MFELSQYLPYLINRAGVRLAVNFARDIAEQGVGVQEWRVLAALAAHGPQRLSELSTLTSIDLSTLSRLVDRMERHALLRRERAAADRRALSLRLSAEGRRVTAAIIPTARRYERVALEGLTAAEARSLKRLLRRVYANLDRLERERG
jgi:DNA-binding MarR family transcriptional regulator